MYLSRMLLNPQRRKTRFFLASPHAMHAAVMSCFPTPLDGVNRERVLWRIDQLGNRVVLYIVSPDRPSFEHLQEQAGWSAQSSWDTRPYGAALQRIENGQTFAFRVLVNPTHVVTKDGKKKRMGHETAEHQLRWLIDRSSQAGFSVVEQDGDPMIRVVRSDKISFRRGSGKVTLVRAGFDGVLRVEDATAFVRTLTQGIGRGKGYGCGLLTIAAVAASESAKAA
ncbi:type I-E CRISPR-associated protein Cas6/Cse3/CasE [Corynebacterium heidelbergense]|uniref:Type I-E CRISPR-associated protein Cas6/Cse3/CasE n=1 Tax=Corynebacterium heidelbergense TaxID=2055947 RepID=A0A364V4Y4_9CORY|nr:type I-E CRISPR-associated protein Cas6/Cse3/CasE [Corynebacterium heidelbergense]RAV31705.1 type I-E CRISPR-associated protein Cas6/Cse3/CasE [Corynebacterium heidelbergense]